eukprot:jgi/Botrbrau1/17020/Bobra.49_2s0076.1
MLQHQKLCCILKRPLLHSWRAALAPLSLTEPRVNHVNRLCRSPSMLITRCTYHPTHQTSEHIDTPDMLEQSMYEDEPVVQPPLRVLLTNDDGGDSPFFVPWAAYVQEKLGWKCMVCPPAQGQSFVSKSISMRSVRVDKLGDNLYHIEGSPATCVNIGLYQLAPDCDFVISGPNVGHNVGRGSVLSSGTVGAALEGCISGRRAVAISFPFFGGWNNWTDEDLARALQAAGNVVKELWESWPAYDDVLYNINVPLDFRDVNGNPKQAAKVVYTRVDTNSQYTSLYRLRDGESGLYDWGPVGLRVFQAPNNDPEGDVAAIKQGNISVTALRAGFLPHT